MIAFLDQVLIWLAQRPIVARALLIAVAVLLLLSTALGLRLRIVTLQRDNARLQVDDLGAVISFQNGKVAEWKAAADRQADQVRQAQQAADRARIVARQRLARLQALPVPTDCSGAIAWGAVQARELVKGWTQ